MYKVNENISDNKRIAKNTVFLYFRMILIVCIGLYTSRVVLQTLGVIDYGIFTAVGGIVAMLGFLNTSMASSTQRFITYALGGSNDNEVNRVFNTCFWVHFLVALIVFIFAETIGLWFLYEKMVIPEERFSAGFWCYQSSIFASIIVILSVPYNSLIIAYERMSIFAYISFFEVTMNLGIVLLLGIGYNDKLILYALLFFVVRIIIFFVYKIYCNKYISTSKFCFFFDKDTFKSMVKFSMWSMNGHLALVGASQGINILLNVFFGPAINAAHGVATQVQSHVYAFCLNFNLAAKPQITKLYANKMYKEMHKLVLLSSKFSYYLMIVLSLPIILCINPILKWWLGLVPDYSAQFVIIMLISSLARSLSFPLIASVHATGNLKRFQLWEGTTLLMVVPIAYLLLRLFHVNPMVVMSVYLVLEIVAQIIRVWIVLPMIQMPINKYIWDVIRPVVLVTFFIALLPIIYIHLSLPQNVLIVLSSIVFSILYGIVLIYLLGCNHEERKAILSFLTSKMSLKVFCRNS